MATRKKPIGIGLVGLGFMGLTHLRAAKKLKGAKLVAVADSDPRRAGGDFSKVKGNFGSAGAKENFKNIATYTQLDDLLADDKVDLVDICLPSHLHPGAVIRSLKAGKPVLVEKPVALTTADANRMLAAGKKTGQMLMVAQVLKFFPEFAAIRIGVEKGTWGRLLAFHARRIIAMPDWGDGGWFSDPKKSGGMVVDLHIHDTDFILNLAGKPRAVTSTGLARKSQIDYIRTTYHGARKEPLLSAEAGWISAPSLAFEHGYDAFFEKATIQFNSTSCPKPRIFTAKTTKDLPLPKGSDGFQNELQAAVDSVRKGVVNPLLSAESAATALAVCLAEKKAVLSGKKVVIR